MHFMNVYMQFELRNTLKQPLKINKNLVIILIIQKYFKTPNRNSICKVCTCLRKSSNQSQKHNIRMMCGIFIYAIYFNNKTLYLLVIYMYSINMIIF